VISVDDRAEIRQAHRTDGLGDQGDRPPIRDGRCARGQPGCLGELSDVLEVGRRWRRIWPSAFAFETAAATGPLATAADWIACLASVQTPDESEIPRLGRPLRRSRLHPLRSPRGSTSSFSWSAPAAIGPGYHDKSKAVRPMRPGCREARSWANHCRRWRGRLPPSPRGPPSDHWRAADRVCADRLATALRLPVGITLGMNGTARAGTMGATPPAS
jgi:hypothetical protein